LLPYQKCHPRKPSIDIHGLKRLTLYSDIKVLVRSHKKQSSFISKKKIRFPNPRRSKQDQIKHKWGRVYTENPTKLQIR